MPLGEGVWGHPSTPLSCIPSPEREEENSWDPRSLRQRCLQALAAMSTHPSIVRETVPVLLQHLRKVQKGNAAHGRRLHGVFMCRRCLCYQGWLGERGAWCGARSPGLGCGSCHWCGRREGVVLSWCRSGEWVLCLFDVTVTMLCRE